MEFHIFGPVELNLGERSHNAGWARERQILAILLMSPGRPVSIETLAARIWDGNPPDKAGESLHSPLSRIRRYLREKGLDGVLLRTPAGYVLDIAPDDVDYHRFLRLRNRAQAAADTGDDEHAVRLYREAMALCREEPLQGIRSSWADWTRAGIEEEVAAVAIRRFELELRLGHHAEAVDELRKLVERFPLHEKLIELFMLALHRTGRTTEALAAYQRNRRRLVDELGPRSPDRLWELSRRIRAGDPTLLVPARSAVRPLPALPRDLSTFIGRTEELDRLISACDDATVTVLAIDGMPGVGKSTLAIRLAHRLAKRYPHGQILLNLHGHDPAQEPLTPAEALLRLLRMIGVPDRQIPPGLAERATLWRAELATRRMLVLLDDAVDDRQVRHLFPGTPGCLVVITSRQRLTGLDDIVPLSLEVLPDDDATALLARIAGPGRAREKDALAAAVRLCGRLPLALQLAGSHLRHRSTWRVADLVAELRGSGRLTKLRAGDRALVAAFELSYRDLGEEHQQGFRLLGLYPGTELSAACAAALLGVNLGAGQGFLQELVDHHLITEPRRGRYRFHDLIGEYAAELARGLPEAEREAATGRLLDHYLLMADRADRLLYPHRPRLPTGVTGDGRLGTAEAAKEWLRAELDDLPRIIRLAVSRGRLRHAALLPHVLGAFLEAEGLWEEAAALHRRGLTAWREIGDPTGIAHALTDLARVCWRLGRLEEALGHAQEALPVWEEIGDQRGAATALDLVGQIHWHRSEYDLALSRFNEALDLRRSLGDRRGEAEALAHTGIILWHKGKNAEATARAHTALALYREVGEAQGEQMVLNNIGDIELELGHNDEALRYYREAAAVGVEMKRQHRAVWLNNVANVHSRTGRYEEAMEHYRKALEIYQEIGDRRGEADTFNNIGACLITLQGREAEARVYLERALEISQDISERYEKSRALRYLGVLDRQAGRYSLAVDRLRRACEVARSIGDERQEARALREMADALDGSGDLVRAREARARARAIFGRLGLAHEAGTVETSRDG